MTSLSIPDDPSITPQHWIDIKELRGAPHSSRQKPHSMRGVFTHIKAVWKHYDLGRNDWGRLEALMSHTKTLVDELEQEGVVKLDRMRYSDDATATLEARWVTEGSAAWARWIKYVIGLEEDA